MTRVFLLLAVFLTTANQIHGLSCIPCWEAQCDDPGKCKYGYVKSVCGCCDECGKGPGEECGGSWGLLGTCGDGYRCQNKKQPEYLIWHPQGICVPEKSALISVSRSSGRPSRQAGGVSGLLGGVRVGQTKKLAKQHKHQAFGSAIPPEYAALLQERKDRGKRDLSEASGEYLASLQGQQRFRRASLPGRRVGSSKLTATKHTHQVSGGIPPEIAALLREYMRNRQG
ncbi:hypothetical protein SK128_020670 [Halocaridina rubra]|uniref:IGFBP N-terminal domain-containing protein n=1 Tax=Halocaridina rubra TaxID=373956 RepID=A0AAN8X3D3_HALRR